MSRIVSAFLIAIVLSAVPPGEDRVFAATTAADELTALARSGGKPLIADFGLGFCMQCKKQAQTLKEIRETYGDKVILRMVNVGKEQELTARYEVELIPTLVFIDAAGKVVLKKVGPMGYGEIRKQLSRMGVR